MGLRNRGRDHLNAWLKTPNVEIAAVWDGDDLASISCRPGRTLAFDAENYRCEGDAEATAMFRRRYRSPLVHRFGSSVTYFSCLCVGQALSLRRPLRPPGRKRTEGPPKRTALPRFTVIR